MKTIVDHTREEKLWILSFVEVNLNSIPEKIHFEVSAISHTKEGIFIAMIEDVERRLVDLANSTEYSLAYLQNKTLIAEFSAKLCLDDQHVLEWKCMGMRTYDAVFAAEEGDY